VSCLFAESVHRRAARLAVVRLLTADKTTTPRQHSAGSRHSAGSHHSAGSRYSAARHDSTLRHHAEKRRHTASIHHSDESHHTVPIQHNSLRYDTSPCRHHHRLKPLTTPALIASAVVLRAFRTRHRDATPRTNRYRSRRRRLAIVASLLPPVIETDGLYVDASDRETGTCVFSTQDGSLSSLITAPHWVLDGASLLGQNSYSWRP